MVFRFGLLYSGYAKDRWYWEIFVVARKILLIVIVSFGRSNESQLHYALGVLIFLLYMQERAKPFEDHNDSTSAKEKKQQHMLHLSEVGSLVVLLTMVWVAVFFNVSPCTVNGWDCIALSIVVFCSNLLFIAMCSYVGFRAFAERNHLNEKIANMSSLFRMKTVAKIETTSQSSTKTDLDIAAETFPTESVNDKVLGAVMLKQNPLANGKSRLSFARQRKAYMLGGKIEGEVELTNVSEKDTCSENEVENEIVENDSNVITEHNDVVTGRRFSYNSTTEETKWLDDKDTLNIEVENKIGENDVNVITEHNDAATGRRFSYNSTTEETKWLDEKKTLKILHVADKETLRQNDVEDEIAEVAGVDDIKLLESRDGVLPLPLPLNWKKVDGANSGGNSYYWNLKTNQTQYERPNY